FYLAFHTAYGWMFGAGLTAMAIAWLFTTGMAGLAIYKGMVGLHRQWMTRSYIVTFGFVFLRLTTDVLEMGNIGNLSERLAFSSWVSWTVPLLVVEMVFQARKVFASRPPLRPLAEE